MHTTLCLCMHKEILEEYTEISHNEGKGGNQKDGGQGKSKNSLYNFLYVESFFVHMNVLPIQNNELQI